MKHATTPIAPAVAALAFVVAAGCTPAPTAPLAGPAWFQLDDASPDDESGALTGYVLRAGRIGAGTGVRIELPPEAFAEGPYAVSVADADAPAARAVLFGHNDATAPAGARSSLELVDVDTGARRVLVSSSAVLRRAIVHGDALYVLALDQETRGELGIYRFSLAAALAAPRALEDGALVLPGLPREKRGEELFGPTFATLLAVDETSGALVVQSCGEILCRARVLDLASGQLTVRDEIGQGEMLGAVDGEVIVYEAGNGWPCKVLAIDTETGVAREVAFAYGATVHAAEEARTLVFESGDEPGLLLARDLAAPASEAPRMLGVFDVTAGDDDALHPVAGPARSLAGVDLPAGLVALGGDGRVAGVHAEPDAFFVRLDDGALFQSAAVVTPSPSTPSATR